MHDAFLLMQKKSQISLRCKRYRKNQLACLEKNDMLMSRNDNKRNTEDNFSIVFKKQWLKTSCDGYASGRTASRMAHIRNIRSRRLIDT